MAKLTYLMLLSLDGYMEDADGGFAWAEPSEEVHSFINDLARPIGTYLYGRLMYETMTGWETDPSIAAISPVTRDFAELWQAAEKVVFSTTLEVVETRRTRIEREFDPQLVQDLKASAARDIAVAGPELAAHAFRAGLVDACQLFVVPVIVGGGKRALPDDLRADLELREERSFENGTVFLHYGIRHQ